MINTILLAILVLGVASIYFQRRQIADAKALWWATVSEPIAYLSDDPWDDTVSARATNARAALKSHGNQYLKESDVWEYVYSATPETPTRDFHLWHDWAIIDIQKRREMNRQQKAQWNADAAKDRFAGQVNPSAN